MIEIEELTKRHRGVTVVDRLSFSVPDGAVTGFVGPNGAGKTSTMRMCVGLDRADSGRAVVDGRPLREHRHPQEAVGVVLMECAGFANSCAASRARDTRSSSRITSWQRCSRPPTVSS